jgi:hypothetical protein
VNHPSRPVMAAVESWEPVLCLGGGQTNGQTTLCRMIDVARARKTHTVLPESAIRDSLDLASLGSISFLAKSAAVVGAYLLCLTQSPQGPGSR